jgi:hypothetical protein
MVHDVFLVLQFGGVTFFFFFFFVFCFLFFVVVVVSVIDFYVRVDNRVMIIELVRVSIFVYCMPPCAMLISVFQNPFHNGAGGCLFNWRDNRDQFMHGPFEFRITETVQDPLRYAFSTFHFCLTFSPSVTC